MVADDAAQTAIADRIIRGGVYVPLTVLLEVGWVLQSRYAMTRPHLAASLRDLFAVPNIALEGGDATIAAVARFAQGGDFADHIHLVAARGAAAFVTFDRALTAQTEAPVAVEVAE